MFNHYLVFNSIIIAILLMVAMVVYSQDSLIDTPSAKNLYEWGIDAYAKKRTLEAELYRKHLFDLSFTYEGLGEFATAVEYAEYGYKLSLIKDKNDSWEFSESLRCISQIYTQIPDSAFRAVELVEKAIGNIKKIKGENSKEYALYLCLAADYYNNIIIGNKTKALQYIYKSAQILENIDPYSDDYLNVLSQLTIYYADNKDYTSALTCVQKLKEFSENKSPERYSRTLGILSHIYIGNNNYSTAKQLLTEAISLCEKYQLYTEDYWGNLSLLLALQDLNTSERMNLFYKLLKFINTYKDSNWDKLTIAGILQSIAWEFMLYGDEDSALKILLEENTIWQDIPIIFWKEKTDMHLLLAEILSDRGEYQNALEQCKTAYLILHIGQTLDNIKLARVLSKIAHCYNQAGEYDNAIIYGNAVVEIHSKEDPFNINVVHDITNVAQYYINSAKYDSAKMHIGASLVVLDSLLTLNSMGDHNPKDNDDFSSTYSYILSLQAQCLLNEQLYEMAYSKIEQQFWIVFNHIISRLNTQTHIMREMYIRQYVPIMNEPISYEIRYSPSPILNRLCYNILLFKKGILWNYQKITRSDNIKHSDTYTRKGEHRSFIPTYLFESEQEHISLSQFNMDSVSKGILVTLDSVSAQMLNNNISIEFSKCKYNKSSHYIALIFRKDWEAPKCVIICEEAQLENMEYAQLQQTVWQAIIDSAQIKEGENIYFAPDGIFYNIPIEYLPTADGRCMSDKYNMFRVSSTRELCFRDSIKQDYSSAVLYGGLRYDAAPQKTLAHSNNTYRGFDDINETVWSSWRAEDRAKYNYLPYTLMEVDSISHTINNIMQVTTYTDSYGNEESFKAMSGSSPSILHIATHGYYITPTTAEKMSQENMQRYGLSPMDGRQNVIDYSMERTGLLLAGAQYKLRGDTVPPDVEDGILSAKEISHLDLGNTDLVVLSACQTALGDITDDGVAGLQRGFKIAGVKSILMSLWKVDDAATYLFMKQFYKSLAEGKNKQKALHNAQAYLRAYTINGEQPYNDIHYWGAFILLDSTE